MPKYKTAIRRVSVSKLNGKKVRKKKKKIKKKANLNLVKTC